MRHSIQNGLASLPKNAFACFFLNLLLVGILAWFARERLPLPLVGLTMLLAGLGELAGLWFISQHREVAQPAPNRVVALVRRSDQMRRGSIRDEATGLYHRWYFELRLDEEAARCRRYGLSMAVVVVRCGVVDITSFEGDGWRDSAAEAGRRTVQVVRTVDLSSSLSPLEFAVCLVHCDFAGAERAVERLVMELSEFNCEAGIAVFPDNNCAPAALIELARGRARQVALANSRAA